MGLVDTRQSFTGPDGLLCVQMETVIFRVPTGSDPVLKNKQPGSDPYLPSSAPASTPTDTRSTARARQTCTSHRRPRDLLPRRRPPHPFPPPPHLRVRHFSPLPICSSPRCLVLAPLPRPVVQIR
jgi:hypothetical protein